MPFVESHATQQYLDAIGGVSFSSGQQNRQDVLRQQNLQLQKQLAEQQIERERIALEKYDIDQRQRGFSNREQSLQEIQRIKGTQDLEQQIIQGQQQQQQKDQDLRNKLMSGNFEYTMKQKQEMSRIINSMQMIQSDPSWTPNQRKQAIHALQMKMSGIQYNPMPNLQEPSPFPQGKGPGDTWQDEQGNFWTRDQKGNARIAQPGFSYKDKATILVNLIKNFTDYQTNQTNWSKVSEAFEEAKKMMGQDSGNPLDFSGLNPLVPAMMGKASIPAPMQLPNPQPNGMSPTPQGTLPGNPRNMVSSVMPSATPQATGTPATPMPSQTPIPAPPAQAQPQAQSQRNAVIYRPPSQQQVNRKMSVMSNSAKRSMTADLYQLNKRMEMAIKSKNLKLQASIQNEIQRVLDQYIGKIQ